MMCYICDICRTAFDRPLLRHESELIDGFRRRDTEALCPVCLSPRFSKAVGCPVCGEPMTERERICRRCRASLLERVNAFAGELLPAELDQFDDWMEDGGITTRSTWR